jgi:predicted anti-sigma-YlaC factor YlaD
MKAIYNKKIIILIFFVSFFWFSCSINKLAVKAVSNSFGDSGITVFSSDEDPQLIKDSLPLILKLHELMIENDPENYQIKAAAGKLFTIYTNLFIQIPADMMDYTEWEKQAEFYNRAKKMYMRSCRYLKESIEIKYKTSIDLSDKNSITKIKFTKDDVDTLYWAGGSIMSAVAIDLTDPAFVQFRNTGIAFMDKAYELDPDYNNGVLHEYFMMYCASITEGMGGGLEKAEYHYKKAIELSKGSRVTPYVNYAVFILTEKEPQNESIAEFKKLLNDVIAFDVDKYPEHRLENTVMKQKAKWLLNNIDNYFLVD